ncbi:hypothetical protein [uncultured Arthrobacter sp.]|uniref:hypothetical protein n=1 Tax=uncultured Arthrobacter sp. TaxID=114050 RepID=UPI00261CDA3A|nr:hypothetical protein [uncultured Arthrobacter sp.]
MTTTGIVVSTGVDLLIGALPVYAVLRLALRTGRPERPPMRAARRHAMVAAFLALAAGGVLGPPPLHALATPWPPASGAARGAVFSLDLTDTLTPLLSIVGIYLIAQFTGPRCAGDHDADRRARHVREYLPRYLTAFTGMLVLVGFAAIALTVPVSPLDPQDAPVGGFAPSTSRVPGPYFASIAGISYTMLIVGVVLTLQVIVRRRRVAALTQMEDIIMRGVFVNRLLRTTALVTVLVVGACLEFAAPPSAGPAWDPLRFGVGLLSVTTLLMVIAARPRFEPPHLPDADRPPAPAGSLPRARSLVGSGQRIGYAVWCLGVVPLLFSLGVPLGGPLQLGMLTVAYLAFLGVQLWAEVILLRNHGLPSAQRVRPRLPAALLALGVPALVMVIGTAWLALWVGSLPGASTLTAPWWVSFALLLTGSVAVLFLTLTRPRLRLASETEDRSLRAAVAARTLLMTVSGMLALAAFVLSDNRAALVPDDALMQAVPYSPGAGQLSALVIALFLAAVVVAVLPVRSPGARRPVAPEQVSAS